MTLNPSVDLTLTCRGLDVGALNRCDEPLAQPSGKGVNVSRALARLGAPSTAVCILGGRNGAYIKAQLEAAGIGCIAFRSAGETRTNVKVFDGATGQLTELNTPGPPVSPSTLKSLMRRLPGIVGPGDTVVLSGSLPRGAPKDLYGDLVDLVAGAGAKAVCDLQGELLTGVLPRRPDLVKPNRHEAEALLGVRLSTLGDAVSAARRILALGARSVLLSLGAGGAVYAGESDVFYAKPPAVAVQSTAGCGDALLGSFLLASDELRAPGESALAFAVAASAAAAELPGTSFPDRTHVEAILQGVRVVALDLDGPGEAEGEPLL